MQMDVLIQVRHEKELVRVAAKPAAAYADLPLTAMTAYSLFWLQQWQLRRSIEAIAVLNWRLFPQKFAMIGFPEYPEAFRTNRSLLQMQPKYRNLLTGAATKGFSLNARGIEVAHALVATLGVPQTGDCVDLGQQVQQPVAIINKKAQTRSIEPEAEIRRMRSSKLYEKWKAGLMGERDLIHVHSLLRIFDHTPARARQRAMRDIEMSAKDLGDTDALKFLSDVRRTFPLAGLGSR